MSSVATFYRIKKSSVDAIIPFVEAKKGLFTVKDQLGNKLNALSIMTSTYEDTGYDIGALIPFLDEHDCNIAKSDCNGLCERIVQKRKISAIMLDENDRKTLKTKAGALDSITEEEYRNYFEELYGIKDCDAGERMKKCLRGIRKLSEEIETDELLLVLIDEDIFLTIAST